MLFQKGNIPWNKGLTYKGIPRSEETKKKIGLANKGKIITLETKKKMSLAQKGRKHTEESRRKMSNSHKGKIFSEEHRRNLSLAGQRRKQTDETKRKLSIAHKGKKLSSSHKAKISKATKNQHKLGLYKEVYKKISKSKLGHIVLEETRQKLREIRKKQEIPISHTKPELQFMSLVEKYHLPYKYVGDGKFWIESINPDFINCNGEKIAIEIFGDYWHDPKQRKNIRWIYTEEGRKQILANYGWKCVVIWESELKELSDEEILKKINGGIRR